MDDNPDDLDLLTLCLARVGARFTVQTARSGPEALALIRGGRPGARPQLVLLDLNMPEMGGRDVLAELRADPNSAGLPVLVLSSSDAPADVEALYRLGANGYLLKPAGLAEFRALAEALDRFWCGVALLPG